MEKINLHNKILYITNIIHIYNINVYINIFSQYKSYIGTYNKFIIKINNMRYL